jgi:hypothetical protein
LIWLDHRLNSGVWAQAEVNEGKNLKAKKLDAAMVWLILFLASRNITQDNSRKEKLMATFDMDFVDKNYPTLEDFAREDGCFSIYKIAMTANGPYTHYVTIRKPQDETAMRGSSSVHKPILVWKSR